jgi:hypothetical protein
MPEAWEARNCRQVGDTRCGQDPPDGALPDSMAETEQFTSYTPLPPSRILPGQPDHQQIQQAEKHER